MPRPGPRPYECVRRAWHSDRHQPMRGSLIQEIFRLANEVHSHGTRKNKEWQEKLPFVVLKAEEIMYSKANSEAEYMDLKTLWDRANDAIDTIIRKDDANESDDLLHPCIEAALNLGCIPRRASRSQRHSNPVCYLNPNMKDAADTSQKSQDNNKAHQISSTSMLPPLIPIQSNHLHCSSTQLVSKCFAVGPEIQFMPYNASREQKASFRSPNKEFPHIVRGLPMPKESCIWPNMGRVYPLYYDDRLCAPNSQLQDHMVPRGQMISSIFAGSKPSVQSSIAGDKIFSAEFVLRKMNKLPQLAECDLTLRLGLPSPPASEVESSWAHEIEDVGLSGSCEGSKSCGPLPSGAGTLSLESSLSSARDKGFDFFSANIDEHCESYQMNACDGNQIGHGHAPGALTDQHFS